MEGLLTPNNAMGKASEVEMNDYLNRLMAQYNAITDPQTRSVIQTELNNFNIPVESYAQDIKNMIANQPQPTEDMANQEIMMMQNSPQQMTAPQQPQTKDSILRQLINQMKGTR